MRSLDKRNYYIDAVALLSIGIFCLCYLMFSALFAELNIQLPFLDFPIFVGEILLFGCLVLFLIKYFRNPQKLNKWHYLIIFYFIFVLIKALYGYLKWGPLALRHSALLYYPIFVIFGYTFFRKEFFKREVCSFLLLLIILVFVDGRFTGYWTLTLAVLGFILIKSYPDKIAKFIMLLAFLVTIPYVSLFYTSRMMIVANFVSGVYLTGVLPFILGIKTKFKFTIILVIGGLIVLGLFKFADHSALRSIVNFKRMIKVFEDKNKVIEANLSQYRSEERRDVRLYNPNRVSRTNLEARAFKKAFKSAAEDMENAFIRMAKEKQEFSEGQAKEERIRNEIRWALIDETRKRMKRALFEMEETGEAQTESEIRKAFINRVNEEIDEVSAELEKGGDSTVLVEQVKKDMLTNFETKVEKQTAVPAGLGDKNSVYYNDNAVFRFLIWRDMLVDLANEKPIFGFDFGKPLRSKSLEILYWGYGDWSRDGWIGAHNSYLNIIYRTGIIGIVFVVSLLIVLFRMIKRFVLVKSLTGILLCAILINWLVAANFLLILELPYTAIPIWTIFGMTYAYFSKLTPSTTVIKS